MGRAVALDQLNYYLSMWVAYRDLAPKLNIGAESHRKGAIPAEIDAAAKAGLLRLPVR